MSINKPIHVPSDPVDILEQKKLDLEKRLSMASVASNQDEVNKLNTRINKIDATIVKLAALKSEKENAERYNDAERIEKISR